jgi:hypothetical protein
MGVGTRELGKVVLLVEAARPWYRVITFPWMEN